MSRILLHTLLVQNLYKVTYSWSALVLLMGSSVSVCGHSALYLVEKGRRVERESDGHIPSLWFWLCNNLLYLNDVVQGCKMYVISPAQWLLSVARCA